MNDIARIIEIPDRGTWRALQDGGVLLEYAPFKLLATAEEMPTLDELQLSIPAESIDFRSEEWPADDVRWWKPWTWGRKRKVWLIDVHFSDRVIQGPGVQP